MATKKKKKVAPASPKRGRSAKKTSAKKAPAKKVARSKAQPKAAAKKVRAVAKKKRAVQARAKSAAKKPAKAAKKKPAPRPPARPRRDATGHLNPEYAAELLEKSTEGMSRDPNQDAFLHGPKAEDDLAEELGETTVATMTTGEETGEETLNRPAIEEVGGPFVVTPAATEFAPGTDASNPKGAKPEPFPKV